MARSCGLCQSQGSMCHNCEAEKAMDADLDESQDGVGATARSKSPMVESPSRKVQRMSIGTPGPYTQQGNGGAGSASSDSVNTTLFGSEHVKEVVPKFSNDDIMAKLTNMMNTLSTKDDVKSAITAAVVLCQHQYQSWKVILLP